MDAPLSADPPASHTTPDSADVERSVTERIRRIRERLGERIIGQKALVDRLLITLLSDGHLLVEGAPGLAKTTAVKALAEGMEADFHRVQFTPDLLPADLTGTEIYRPQDASFSFQPGPIFHNVVLADEVNRAPAKVQSALLEAMGERQVTVGHETYPLPPLFMVMATQNPIEQEGTYPLPEAQLDRFLLHVTVDYPAGESEKAILNLARGEALDVIASAGSSPDPHAGTGAKGQQAGGSAPAPLSQTEVFAARQAVLATHIAPNLEAYLIELILATRQAARYGDRLQRWIEYGASPRATIGLDRVAKAHAWLNGRDYVSPEDIQAMAPNILRHRVLLTFEAEADGVKADHVVEELLNQVAVP